MEGFEETLVEHVTLVVACPVDETESMLEVISAMFGKRYAGLVSALAMSFMLKESGILDAEETETFVKLLIDAL